MIEKISPCSTVLGETSIFTTEVDTQQTYSRYDFTPLSVDENRMGKLEVEERSGVSVTLPHTNGVDATKYTGPAKEANARDCVLIFDHETGELTLERLSNQVNEGNLVVVRSCIVFLSDSIKKDQSGKEP